MIIDPPDDFDPADLDAVIDDIQVDVQTRADAAIDAAADQYLRRIERELYTAWMAGMDAVDVLEPRFGTPHPGEDVFDPAAQMRYKAVPRQSTDTEPVTADGFQTTRYFLDDIDADTAHELRDRCRRR
jgi:hypothetical protein